MNNISFSFGHNEIIGVVGESGSGKSLIALTLIGLQPEQSKIKAEKLNFLICFLRAILKISPLNAILNFLDSDLRSFTQKKWQKYRGSFQGMIFQEPQSSLNPTLKCGKQLIEVLNLNRKMSLNEKKGLIVDTLKEVQLLDANRIMNS